MTRALALTLGDPAGIGPEIALKAYAKLKDDCDFFVIGDADLLARLGQETGTPVSAITSPSERADGLRVLHTPLPGPITPGQPTPANAPAVVEFIRTGVDLVRTGAASALVTNPINKAALYDGAGFAFPGHTEFLADLTNAPLPVMMLGSGDFRVVPVTIHIPLAEVPRALTADLLADTIRTAEADLRHLLALPHPRIAVAGLNPHAGEGGAMGDEEINLITPVIKTLQSEGLAVTGPYPADTMFHAEARARYDLAVCMYHDQALIPAKTIDFAGGVNTTLGLPIIRTSPDHGTAYDIAGQSIADPSSLVAALRQAAAFAAA
ncbi:4-hydroxythreonine-4-phosphate dehydrogenase PdxA [Halovulum sp. GXIMD14793]